MDIDRFLNGIETGFNMAECTPILCIYSGILRTIAGKVQQTVGWIFAAVGGIGLLVSSDDKWGRVCELGFKHMIHGALNVIRGFGTALLGINSYGGLGNVFLLIPNLKQKPPFSPYYDYEYSLRELLLT